MAGNAEKPHSAKVGRYRPVCFGPSSWWRFSQDRRRRYLKLLPDVPDERQLLAVNMLIECEWGMRRAEADAANAANDRYRYNALRLSADLKKQVLLWHRELNAAIAASAKTEPTAPPAPSLTDVLSEIANRRQAEPEAEPPPSTVPSSDPTSRASSAEKSSTPRSCLVVTSCRVLPVWRTAALSTRPGAAPTA